MKKNRLFLLLIGGFLSLASCDSDSDFISLGFNSIVGDSGPMIEMMVVTAIKAPKRQSLDASFDVYPGATASFCEKWSNNYWNCNDGTGVFGIVWSIHKGKDIYREGHAAVDDFLDIDKYIVTYENLEGIDDGMKVHFSDDYISLMIDFSSLSINNGYVSISFGLYDDQFVAPINFQYQDISFIIDSGYSLEFSIEDGAVYLKNI